MSVNLYSKVHVLEKTYVQKIIEVICVCPVKKNPSIRTQYYFIRVGNNDNIILCFLIRTNVVVIVRIIPSLPRPTTLSYKPIVDCRRVDHNSTRPTCVYVCRDKRPSVTYKWSEKKKNPTINPMDFPVEFSGRVSSVLAPFNARVPLNVLIIHFSRLALNDVKSILYWRHFSRFPTVFLKNQ